MASYPAEIGIRPSCVFPSCRVLICPCGAAQGEAPLLFGIEDALWHVRAQRCADGALRV